MESVQQLYNILEKMLAAAQQRDKPLVDRLNRKFERNLLSRRLLNDDYLEYDRCRQSCVLAFTQPIIYDLYLDDARQRMEGLASHL